ncbi:MAG: xanthine dehydrogenase family protein molybdopterin-binding subunit [Actinobacteria bacterium]|nr:xanthine dehydrogenase family protein molybdopterin-binding subunit [Actinomycetota bacterium]
MTTTVGRSVTRIDGRDKVTGAAVFGVDLAVAGMLHGAVVRSPHPHARIVSIDPAAAAAAPGVEVIVTGADFPYLFGSATRDQPFLAIDRVRYVGEPVVAIAARTEAEAQEAADLVVVEYEELPAVCDMRDALAEDAPLVHPDMHTYVKGAHVIVPHTNINTLWTFERGDVEAGFAGADLIVEDEFTAHALSHAALEPHVSIAAYDPVNRAYTLWLPTDRPFQVRGELTAALGIPSDKVRLIVTSVGGSFGGKNTLISEAISVALARFAGGRPVRVEFTRQEDLTATSTRVPAIMKLRTGVTRDGSITARSAEALWDSGAYTSNTVGVAIRGSSTIFGPYRTPHLSLVVRQVYTNRATTGSYRGYGTTQVTWACESQMDMIAAALGLDPLAFRLRNGYEEGDPYINEQIMHGVGLRESLERTAAEIGWGEVDRAPAPHLRRGKGIATMLKPTATPTSSNAVIKVEEDGRVTVLVAAPEIGAGQSTVLAQIAADAIGVPIEAVVVPGTDTAYTPYNGPVASSRTTFHVGNAIVMAGAEIREKILAAAADILDRDAGRLDLVDGRIVEDGVPIKPLSELFGGLAYGDGYSITAEARYSSKGSPLLKAAAPYEWMSSIFWMFATHAAEIEVDIETGAVRVVKVAAAGDVGRAINPMACEQQIEGGVVMGISNALFEEFKGSGGRIENGSFADYKLAALPDIPEIVAIIVESQHAEAPFGAKGIGEPAAAATPPAIANALFDAVGIRILDLPITPEKVLRAIAEKASAEGAG